MEVLLGLAGGIVGLAGGIVGGVIWFIVEDRRENPRREA